MALGRRCLYPPHSCFHFLTVRPVQPWEKAAALGCLLQACHLVSLMSQFGGSRHQQRPPVVSVFDRGKLLPFRPQVLTCSSPGAKGSCKSSTQSPLCFRALEAVWGVLGCQSALRTKRLGALHRSRLLTLHVHSPGSECHGTNSLCS